MFTSRVILTFDPFVGFTMRMTSRSLAVITRTKFGNSSLNSILFESAYRAEMYAFVAYVL